MQNLQPNVSVASLEESTTNLNYSKSPKIEDQALKQSIKEAIDDDFPIKTERWDMKKASMPMIIGAVVIAIGAGVATGWGSKSLKQSSSTELSNPATQQVAGDTIKAGDVFGSNSENFKDSAEGYLEKGGIDGEGSHKLVRPGGISQTVYLTSSVTDLDKFAGMQIKVLGETYQGQKAGWLMDVGKVEIVNPEGVNPTVEK